MFVYEIFLAPKVLKEVDLMVESSVCTDYIFRKTVYPVVLALFKYGFKLLFNGKHIDNIGKP